MFWVNKRLTAVSKNLVNIGSSMKFRKDSVSGSPGVWVMHEVQRESAKFIRSLIRDLASLGILGPQGGLVNGGLREDGRPAGGLGLVLGSFPCI